MVEAAAESFASIGYAATTMEAVAKASGMSVQSVYFGFHSKANLLEATLQRALAPSPRRVADRDPDQALGQLVDDAVVGLQESGPLALAAATAAVGDGAVAAVWERVERQRARAATDLVGRLRERRPLAPGVTQRRVSDVVYALLSPQLFTVLVRERGWTTKRYAAWVADSISRALWG